MSKIFPGYLPPFSDEALSSWLYRNALSNSNNSFASKILDWAVMQAKVKMHGDIDLLSQSNDFYLSFLPDKQARLATQTFGVQSDLLLPPEMSLQFCHICLSIDIAKGHAPGFRRCWRYRGICVCNQHAAPVLLQATKYQNVSQYMLAWSGFVSYASSMERATGNRDFVTFSSSSTPDKLRDAQVRHLVSRAQRKVFLAILKFRSTTPLPQRCALEFVLNVLLQEPAEHFKGGCARWYLADSDILWRSSLISEKTSASDFFNQMDTARPRQVAVAYLMIGVACSMFTKRELQLLTDVFYYRPTPFPVTVHEISALIGNVQPPRALRIAAAATECISKNELKSIRWILDALPAA
jgi:hypothetical protein